MEVFNDREDPCNEECDPAGPESLHQLAVTVFPPSFSASYLIVTHSPQLQVAASARPSL